jgi:hypothetical protein
MTLNLQKNDKLSGQNTLAGTSFVYSYIYILFSLLFLLVFMFKAFSFFDFCYISNYMLFENYIYLEILGTNLIEFGAYLYFDKFEILYLAGILLFFALVIAVFLTTATRKPSFFY